MYGESNRDDILIFLSTPSVRRATAKPVGLAVVDRISIHALREEGDQGRGEGVSPPANFYPRPP